MSKYFEFTSDVTDYSGEDDLDHISSYFEYSGDLADYSSDDLDYISSLFTFDDTSGPPPPPPPVFFLFEGGDTLPVSPAFDPTQGIKLSFRDPKALNPYNAKRVLGLDPTALKAKYYKGSFGARFYDISLDPRKIALLIGLNPDFADAESYSILRDYLYKILSYSKTGGVTLYFKDGDTVVATVSGFVSKIDGSLFDRTQEIEVFIDCEAIFRAHTPTVLDPMLFDDNPIIQDLESTAPHGFIFQLKILHDTPSLVITDPGDGTWEFRVTPAGGFLNGDIVHFSSEPDDTKLFLVRAGVVTGLKHRMSARSVWPIIFPGTNNFNVHPATIRWVQLAYYKAYWGI